MAFLVADEGGATPAKRHKIGGAAIADKIISDVGFWPNPDLETFKSAVAAVVDYEYMVRPSLFFLLPRSLRCVFHPPSELHRLMDQAETLRGLSGEDGFPQAGRGLLQRCSSSESKIALSPSRRERSQINAGTHTVVLKTYLKRT